MLIVLCWYGCNKLKSLRMWIQWVYLNNNFYLMLAFPSEHSFKAEPLKISSSGSNQPLGTCSEHKRPRATLPSPGLPESWCSLVPTATQFTHGGGSLSHPILEASVLLFRWAFLANLCTPQGSLNVIPSPARPRQSFPTLRLGACQSLMLSPCVQVGHIWQTELT